jgi:hypothetical protein
LAEPLVFSNASMAFASLMPSPKDTQRLDQMDVKQGKRLLMIGP